MDILKGAGVPSPYGRGDGSVWLVYIPAKERDTWGKQGQRRLRVARRDASLGPILFRLQRRRRTTCGAGPFRANL
eukprot:5839563-Alexandrium_andersonii.AAC.1